METVMAGMFTNEFKCLSNTVFQTCFRLQLPATNGIVPLVRWLAQNNTVPPEHIARVELHQCPQPQGFVKYELHLLCRDGSCYHEEFQGSGLKEPHMTHLLYDRRRDGALEYLHLQH